MLELQTSLGKIVIELDEKNSPETVKNVMSYAEEGYYNGTIFHRVINGFMIQGGGFGKDMQKKATKAPVKNESVNGAKNVSMSVAMARLPDPNSATSQFFINLKDNRMNLDAKGSEPGYTVFGNVVEGEDVVRKIAEVSTHSVGMYDDVPVEAVVIEKAELKTK